jgi:nucleoside-diphosphate-sugar epimerase
MRRLLAAGESVRVLVRPSSKLRSIDLGEAEPIAGDLSDQLSLRRAVEGMEVVCHCAAHMDTASPWSKFEEITVRGTERLLEAACQEKITRFVHISSLGVYGLNGNEKITEESPFDESEESRGYYTRSKVESERLVWKYHREHNLPVTVVRPGVLYGPGKFPFVARVCVWIAPKLRVALGRSGQSLPLAYVEDVAHAIDLVLRSERATGRAYNVVDDKISQKEYLNLLKHTQLIKAHTILLSPTPLYPFLSLFERLCRWISVTPPVSRYQFERALASLDYDTSRAREELGWSPQVGVAEGLMKIRAARVKAGNSEF